MRLTAPITRLLYLLVIVTMLSFVFVLHTVESSKVGDTYALRGADVREEHSTRTNTTERVNTRTPLYRNTTTAADALRASTTLESTPESAPDTTLETTHDEPTDDESESDDTPVEENIKTEVAPEVIEEETLEEIPVAIEAEEPEVSPDPITPLPTSPSTPQVPSPPVEEPETSEPEVPEPVEPLVLSSTLSMSEIQLLLDAHNDAREKVNVSPLTWSPTLAASAQSWADELQSESCKWHHGDTEYGENIFYSWSSDDSFRRNADEPVFWWLNKSQYYDYDTNDCEPGEVCGHYTQVVWEDTEYLGCGRVHCDDGKYFEEVWVCQYDPPGNVIGQKPY